MSDFNKTEVKGAKEENTVRRAQGVKKLINTKDKRYQRSEQAIRGAFFGGDKWVKAKDLAQRAGVGKSTFYRHYGGVHKIMPEIEKRTLGEFNREITKEGLGKRVKTRFLYYRMLAFIYRRRGEFKAIVDRGDERTLEEMITEILPKVARDYHLPKKYQEVLKIYEKEVTAVVETWILGDFSTSEKRVLGDIMYLTRSARERLIAIGK